MEKKGDINRRGIIYFCIRIYNRYFLKSLQRYFLRILFNDDIYFYEEMS